MARYAPEGRDAWWFRPGHQACPKGTSAAWTLLDWSAAEAFYRVADAAYERRRVAVTSNLHPSGFDTIMPRTLATATVDRLLHHAHVVLTECASFRLAEATAGNLVWHITSRFPRR